MHRILAAGAVVTDRSGRLLLVLRGTAPQAGLWTVPGGRVEPGETLAAAAAREVVEETGVVVRILEELGSLDVAIGDGDVFEVHDFAAEYLSRDLIAGDDALDVGWFSPDMLISLPVTLGLIDQLSRWGWCPARRPAT